VPAPHMVLSFTRHRRRSREPTDWCKTPPPPNVRAPDIVGMPRHCEERSDEAIQGEELRSPPWIASPASYDAGSQ